MRRELLPPEKSQLFLWNDRILYVTPAHRSGFSTRYTATISTADGLISLNLDPHSYECWICECCKRRDA